MSEENRDTLSWLTMLNRKGVINEEILAGIVEFYGGVPAGIAIGMRASGFHLTQWDPATTFGNEHHNQWLKFKEEQKKV